VGQNSSALLGQNSWTKPVALPGDPPGNLEVVAGHPEGGKMPELLGNYGAFAPDYAPEEIFEIASKLYKKSRS
jgi:Mn-containing catalase